MAAAWLLPLLSLRNPPPPPSQPSAPKENPPSRLGNLQSGLLVRSPNVPYPSKALNRQVSEEVRVHIQVANGLIVHTDGSGPPILASFAAQWVKANWKFSPTANGTYTLPIKFVLRS